MAKPNTIRKTIDLPEGLSREVDKYQEDYYHSANSQAIIQLIKLGLTYAKKMEDVTLHPSYMEPSKETDKPD